MDDQRGETAIGVMTPDGRVVAIFPLPSGMALIGSVASILVKVWKKHHKEELAVLELNSDWSGWKPLGAKYKMEPGSAVTFTAQRPSPPKQEEPK